MTIAATSSRPRDLGGPAEYAAVFGPGAQYAILMAGAVATALALIVLGVYGPLVILGIAGAVAVMARPEIGLYAVLAALVLPIPIRAGPMVLYPHDFAALLTITSIYTAALRRRDLELPSGLYMVPAVVLLAVQLLSMLNAGNLRVAAAEVVQQAYLLLAAPVAYYLLLRDERVLRRATKFFIGLITAEAVLASMQFCLALAGNHTLNVLFAFGRKFPMTGERAFGTIGPTVGLLLAASAVLWLNQRVPWAWKAAMVCLHTFAVFATGSRTAMVVMLIALVFYGLFARKKALSLKLLVPMLAGLLLFVGVMGVSRFSTALIHPSDSRYRMPIDRKALAAVPRHPFIGHGPKASADLSVSIFGAVKIGVENEYVSCLYNNGVVGLAALLLMGAVPVLGSVYLSRRNCPAGQTSAAMAAIIVSLFAAGLAGCFFEGSLGQWFAIFYAAMLAAAVISTRAAPAAS
ncbi:MAG TPA: O-antigen ligase family protein [Planctomycetota bacterium]|nr:O-antigen ligase family protein [Planctomycetota bacterium]